MFDLWVIVLAISSTDTPLGDSNVHEMKKIVLDCYTAHYFIISEKEKKRKIIERKCFNPSSYDTFIKIQFTG